MNKILPVLLLTLFIRPGASTVTASGHITADAAWDADTVQVTDTVWVDNGATLTVLPGVYVEFQGRFKLKVQGRLLAEGSDMDTIVFTALDKDTGWNGIRFDHAAPENDSSKLVFCRLEYGNARGAYRDNDGGAVYISNCPKIRISNCLIENNRSYRSGAGIYCDSSSPVISGNTIRNNIANTVTNTWRGGGGGICFAYGNPVVTGNIITDNRCEQIHGKGGGVYWGPESDPLVANNVIAGNTARWQGGGLFIDSCGGLLVNNLIAGDSGYYGGGIRLQYSSAEIVNNTVCNNDARYGSGLSLRSSSPAVTNTIVWGNTGAYGSVYLQTDDSDPDFYDCDIQNGSAGFTGSGSGAAFSGAYEFNIDAVPEFADTAAGNFQLGETSPCINTGTPDTAGLGLPERDLADNPRIYPGQTARVDMGAYEFQGEPVAGITLGAALQGRFPVLQVLPNPVQSAAVLYFHKPAAHARVSIYDVNGKRMKYFEDIKTGRLSLDLSGLGSGLYLVRVACGKNQYQKMIALLK